MTRAASPDRVLLMLFCVGLAAIGLGGFLAHAPNRIVDGAPLALWRAPWPNAAAILAGLAALMPLSFPAPEKQRAAAAILAGAALFFACLVGAGHFAEVLAIGARPAARISLGPAFWILISAALLAMLDGAQRAGLSLISAALIAAGLCAGFLLMATQGAFANLALAREYAARHAEFTQQLSRHLTLVGAAVVFALIFSAPLTALALRRAAARDFIFASLGIVQTIPSIALFGVLIAPLSALSARFALARAAGIEGTGAAPAIIALTLYSLAPLVRSFVVGVAEVAPEPKDAATGLGFSRRQMFLSVELPLASPALISGLRVVVIQAIGLATVAALIGAGGLGVFVFQGIGQYALDLVLLGAIPVILLALAADLFFQMLLAAARRRL